jgi:hypothetical protein
MVTLVLSSNGTGMHLPKGELSLESGNGGGRAVQLLQGSFMLNKYFVESRDAIHCRVYIPRDLRSSLMHCCSD